MSAQRPCDCRGSRLWPRAGAGQHPVHRDGLRDVLDPVLAHRLEREVELGLHLIVDVAGDADAARLGEALEARRDVHAVAEDVAVFQDDVADVDADAVADAPVLGLGRLALGHGVLDRDRAFDRVDRASELDQRAIAGELDHAAAVLGDQGFGEFDPMGLDPRERAGLVGADEPAVADHVHGHDGRGLAAHGGGLHDSTFRLYPQICRRPDRTPFARRGRPNGCRGVHCPWPD